MFLAGVSALAFLSAPHALAQSRAVTRAQAALAQGDSARAHRLVRDEARRGTDEAEVWRLRLQLDLAGLGMPGIPRTFRHQQYVDDARALLRRAPGDTLALRVLTRDAVWTVLSYDDRRNRETIGLADPTGRILTPTTGVDARTLERSMTESDFDIERRERLAPTVDLSSRAESAVTRALEYLETWLAADPTSALATAEALRLAVTAERWGAALIVSRAFQAASLDPIADLYAGLAHYRLGDAETAERVFERGLEHMEPAARARFEAIDILLRTADQAAYAADPEGVTERFWDQTDPRLLTPVQERRAEHRARVVEADLLFGIQATDLFDATPPRGAQTPQGQVWIRYGRPARTVSYGVENVVDGTQAVWEYPGFRYVFDDPWRSGEYALYTPKAGAFAGGDATRDDYVMRDRERRRDDPQRTQESDALALDIPTLASRFRAPDGGTEVVVAFGVPARLAGPSGGPVETGVFSLDARGVRQRVVESRQTLAPGRVVGDVWADAATVRLSADGQIRVEVEAQNGTLRGLSTQDLAPLAVTAGLAVSDLLLATSVDDEGRGVVVRDGIGIVPAPRTAFSTGDPVYLYLEAYGLGLEDGRSRYTVEATLTPDARRGGLVGRVFGRGQDPGVAVRTEAEGSRADEAVTFFLDVREQRPGGYTLGVEIVDEVTGQTARAERRVELL